MIEEGNEPQRISVISAQLAGSRAEENPRSTLACLRPAGINQPRKDGAPGPPPLLLITIYIGQPSPTTEPLERVARVTRPRIHSFPRKSFFCAFINFF
jgi:hypothetical protein